MGIQQTLLRGLAPPPIIQWYGSRGVFIGGRDPGFSDTMDYVTIASAGSASNFGDISTGTSQCTGFSGGLSAARGVFKGSSPTSPTANASGRIEYITIASTGNSSSFGFLANPKTRNGGCSNGTRGLFMGGGNPGINDIEYVTIDSAGDATNFGNLTVSRFGPTGNSNGTRGVFGGGNTGNPSNQDRNTIDYVTIATTGNASDFGDLTVARFEAAGFTGGDRGCWAAGGANAAREEIDYVTITSTGNATDFGDLNRADENGPGGNSNNSRGLIGGGRVAPAATATIRYVTISTTSNTSSFGNLTQARTRLGTTGCAGGAV